MINSIFCIFCILVSQFGYSALTIAIELGYEEVVNALLENNKVKDFISATDEVRNHFYLLCA